MGVPCFQSSTSLSLLHHLPTQVRPIPLDYGVSLEPLQRQLLEAELVVRELSASRRPPPTLQDLEEKQARCCDLTHAASSAIRQHPPLAHKPALHDAS